MRHPLFGLAAAGFTPSKNLNQTACTALIGLTADLATSCGSNFEDALASITTSTPQEAATLLDIKCNRDCGDKILDFALETDRCNETPGSVTYSSLKFNIESECLKLDGKYCAVDQLEKMIEKKGSFDNSDMTDPENTELCSPCLKPQLDTYWTFFEQTDSAKNISKQLLDATKSIYYSLYSACSNGSLNANKDKLTFYNGSTYASMANIANNGGSTNNTGGNNTDINKKASDGGVNLLGTGTSSIIMNAMMIAGFFLIL